MKRRIIPVITTVLILSALSGVSANDQTSLTDQVQTILDQKNETSADFTAFDQFSNQTSQDAIDAFLSSGYLSNEPVTEAEKETEKEAETETELLTEKETESEKTSEAVTEAETEAETEVKAKEPKEESDEDYKVIKVGKKKFYVKEKNAQRYVSTDIGLNIRSLPSADAELLGVYMYGDKVSITGVVFKKVKTDDQVEYKRTGWVEVSFDGQDGYIKNNLSKEEIKIERQTETETEKESETEKLLTDEDYENAYADEYVDDAYTYDENEYADESYDSSYDENNSGTTDPSYDYNTYDPTYTDTNLYYDPNQYIGGNEYNDTIYINPYDDPQYGADQGYQVYDDPQYYNSLY